MIKTAFFGKSFQNVLLDYLYTFDGLIRFMEVYQ